MQSETVESIRQRILNALSDLEADRALNPDIPSPSAFQRARQFTELVCMTSGPIVGYADRHVTIRWRGTAVKISHEESYGIWGGSCHVLDVPSLAKAVSTKLCK